jgi:concanavalin A-like lectin/glucanase superfamily protein/type IX secretion system substrate protein
MLFLFIFSTNSYSQNALDFDGIDDKISIPNASSFITNSNMSISFWVYAKNPSPAYPNFDGIAGFRNDVDADFYVLHLATNTLEARFKNSSGVLFEIDYNGFSINDWHHIAMTYDGSQLKLYDNGSAVDSVPANGTIVNISESLHMGFLPFNQPDFHLNGILDDVCLWSKSLSDTEVSAMYNACTQDLSDPDLELCYEFNQGIGGGNNTTITSVIDSKNGINGTPQNFAMTGLTSNFVTYGKNSYAAITEIACNSYTAPSGQIFTTTNIYNDTIPNAAGCDSIITIDLTINTVDTSVMQTFPVTLISNAIGASYQWLDCDNGFTALAGDTNQQFTASINGNYAVAINQNGCIDTSACYSITSVGIAENTFNNLQYSPNPSTGIVNLNLGKQYLDILIEIFEVTGKKIDELNFDSGQLLSLDIGSSPGIYFVKITSMERSSNIKIIIK